MEQPRAQDTNRLIAPERTDRVVSTDGFGVHLRREREMRGVTLEEISSATRIATRFLDALETEHWDRLPGGVFNRGFVRSTAQFLGLDPEAMLAEYALATADSTRNAAPVLIHSQSSWTPRNAPAPPERRWLPLLTVVVILALAAAGGWFGWKRYRAVRQSRAAAAALAAGTASASDAANNNSPVTSEAPTAAAPPGSDSPDAAADPPASQLTSDPSSAMSNGSASSPPATPNATADAPAASAPGNSAAAAATATPPPSAPASASVPLTLKIEAGRKTSVRVSIDGHKSFDGKMPAGSSKTFHANDVFFVTARDAGGLLLSLNGQTLPPLGPQGHPGSIRLSRDNLKSQDGASH